MIHNSTISPTRIGLNAYKKAQRHTRSRKPVIHAADSVHPPKRRSFGAEPSKKDKKAVKISVLKTLQEQSNSGMVRIRDVSSVLDELLNIS